MLKLKFDLKFALSLPKTGLTSLELDNCTCIIGEFVVLTAKPIKNVALNVGLFWFKNISVCAWNSSELSLDLDITKVP